MPPMPTLYEHATVQIENVTEVAKALNNQSPRGWEFLHLIPWKALGAIIIFRRPMEAKPPDTPATEEPRTASAATIAKVKAIRAGRQQVKE